MSCGCGGLSSEALAGYAAILETYLPDSCGVVRFTKEPDGAGGRRRVPVSDSATPGFAAVYRCSVAAARRESESSQGGGEKAQADFEVTLPASADVRPTDQLVIVPQIAPEEWTEERAARGFKLDVIGTDGPASRAVNLTAKCRSVV